MFGVRVWSECACMSRYCICIQMRGTQKDLCTPDSTKLCHDAHLPALCSFHFFNLCTVSVNAEGEWSIKKMFSLCKIFSGEDMNRLVLS